MDFQVKDEELEEGFMKFHINHYPCEFWTRGAVHLHGHIHSGRLNTSNEVCSFKPLRYDIGVDNNNFKPISYEEVKAIITKQVLKMKQPKEYLEEVNSLTTRERLYEIGKQMQIDAYNEALEDAYKNAEAYDTDYCCNTIRIDKQSILKLKK